MKTRFLFLLSFAVLIFSANICQGQSKLKSLKELGYDTVAYMEMNYYKLNLYENQPLQNVLNEAEIPFRSFIIYETKNGMLAAILLFIISAEEVEALHKAGKPIFGVLCNLTDLTEYMHDEVRRKKMREDISRLGTGVALNFNESSVKLLKGLKIDFVWYYDVQEMFKYF